MGTRREKRLRQRRDIAAVQRRGRVERGQLVTVRALRTNLPVSRFAFAAGAPLGNAVARNRVRRRLREIMRQLPIDQSWDVMVSARAAALGATYQELRLALEAALGRAGMLPQ